ncbi:MAG: hypothetical protein ACLQM6_04895 [Acidobacteriaceae bacterium]
MKTAVLCLALLPLLSGFPAIAQAPQPAVAISQTPPVEDFKPATTNQQGKKYPAVNSERRVCARVVAPQAQSVLLDLGGIRYPLIKGDDGAWVGVSNPQDEGFHYYQVIIDGAQVPDPNSVFFYGATRWGSAVEIPAQDQDFYALKDVPHGQMREVLFPSKAANASLPPAKAFAGMQVISAMVRGAVGRGMAIESIQPPDSGQIEAMVRGYPPSEFPNLIASIPFACEFFEHGFEFGVRALARGLLAVTKSG